MKLPPSLEVAEMKRFLACHLYDQHAFLVDEIVAVDAEQRHIRARLAEKDPGVAERVQILYGGSMKGENAAGLLAMADIDGGLIGGASLKADDFLAIAAAAAQG